MKTKGSILEKTLKLKFESIFEEFFIKRPNIKELILEEGNRIFYQEGSEFNLFKLDWNIQDKDLVSFQINIIQSKVEEPDGDLLSHIEKELNNKGHYNYSYNQDGFNFRINWSFGKEDKTFMRIRRIPKNIPHPKDLGIPEVLLEEIRNYNNGGLIIVSAPPGSGKSTTIASAINDLIHEKTINVVTLEDPIEFIYNKETHISSVEQREKGINFDNYRSGIEASMRQSPKIVVIQEMTTPEIIHDVMLLIEKGVMVITTLHTSDTTEIFESILSSFPEEKRKSVLLKLKDNFRLFISQRLINKLDGKNQIAVFEYIKNTNDVKGYISEDNIRNVKQIMDREPHLSFAKDIFNKITYEDISMEDGLKYCPESRLRELKQYLGE